MHVVYLALGSNVGNTQEYIHQALSLLESKLTDIELATVYQTTAFGYENQDDFLNTALRAKTSLTAEELLVFVKDIEHQIGRKERFRW